MTLIETIRPEIFQNYSMGQVKIKHKEEQQATNGTEQQQPTTELNPSGPIIETCQKVLSLYISLSKSHHLNTK